MEERGIKRRRFLRHPENSQEEEEEQDQQGKEEQKQKLGTPQGDAREGEQGEEEGLEGGRQGGAGSAVVVRGLDEDSSEDEEGLSDDVLPANFRAQAARRRLLLRDTCYAALPWPTELVLLVMEYTAPCSLVSTQSGEHTEIHPSSLLQFGFVRQMDRRCRPSALECDLDDATVALLVEFLERPCMGQEAAIKKPLQSADLRECEGFPLWEVEWLDRLTQAQIFALLNVSNKYEHTRLLEILSAKVASMIKGKSPEEIRRVFNITNDFTPDEEEAVTAENRWAEE